MSVVTKTDIAIFSGYDFYNVYKDAEFLHVGANIEWFLSQGYKLRQLMKTVEPGKSKVLTGLWLAKNSPLIVKRTGQKVPVENFEFTQNRLTGLVAGYVFENRLKFPKIESEEAKLLGLKWDNEDVDTCKLYLSAVTGTEHFDHLFSYWPLVCALRKLQLKKIDENSVIKIAKKKNRHGDRMAFMLKTNYEEAMQLWLKFPGASPLEASMAIIASEKLKEVFSSD
ncbi:uncharacterized protein LOC128675728 [Plodia interpunctella]|uniref:uncharacterized protein LOC128675728 n=1 Tax=Plodia interpunctella TaxID=58824 RepID=UPI0023676E07|nr:uncharacterized protein LOC128675728 [Plodia interpunctella]XP_053611285.1 uncharacterized protein LOC128675728 [Plodia interpunctella]